MQRAVSADSSSMKKMPMLLIAAFFLVIQVTQLGAQSAAEAASKRARLIDYSKQFIGRPYLSGGIGPDSFDCSGLVFTCSREAIGVQLPRKTSAMYSFCSAISDNERESGDLVFFMTTSSNEVSHVGIYIGNDQFIHAASDGPNTGVIISSLRENYWKTHYYKTGRFLPVERAQTTATVAVNDTKITPSPVTSVSSAAGATTTSGSADARTSGKISDSGAKKRRSNNAVSHPFFSKVVLDGSLFVDWNFFTTKQFRLNFRGASTMLHARYAGNTLQPGVGTIIRYDSGTEIFQLPVVASLSFGDYVRIFAGPVISIGTPTLPDDNDGKASFFPGIMGICWQTPSFTVGKLAFSFTQDIHYTVFNRGDGSALPPTDSIAAGLVLSSGLRVTLPLKQVLY